MTETLSAVGFPEEQVRERARRGAASIFPAATGYGQTLHGGTPAPFGADLLEQAKLVPPVFMPERLRTLIALGREPIYGDVELGTALGGFSCPLPLYVSAFGSTQVASKELGVAVGRQAGRLGIPLVIGENVAPVNGYHTTTDRAATSLRDRIRGYTEAADDISGGVVVQQSTEDADAEVWNQVYSDPLYEPLLATGRLAFELKVGQGAKPGLGGMTLISESGRGRLIEQYAMDEPFGPDSGQVLRSSSPGTFTDEILRQQVRLMRNNFPRAKVWAKLPPGRDVALAAASAWESGADAVTVDGAEGGAGWAPNVFLDHVGLPLGECLQRLGNTQNCLLASGRIWEGSRAVKAIAMGASGVGLGRAALLAVHENRESGLIQLAESIALEMRMLISALGKYEPGALTIDDLWFAAPT